MPRLRLPLSLLVLCTILDFHGRAKRIVIDDAVLNQVLSDVNQTENETVDADIEIEKPMKWRAKPPIVVASVAATSASAASTSTAEVSLQIDEDSDRSLEAELQLAQRDAEREEVQLQREGSVKIQKHTHKIEVMLGGEHLDRILKTALKPEIPKLLKGFTVPDKRLVRFLGKDIWLQHLMFNDVTLHKTKDVQVSEGVRIVYPTWTWNEKTNDELLQPVKECLASPAVLGRLGLGLGMEAVSALVRKLKNGGSAVVLHGPSEILKAIMNKKESVISTCQLAKKRPPVVATEVTTHAKGDDNDEDTLLSFALLATLNLEASVLLGKQGGQKLTVSLNNYDLHITCQIRNLVQQQGERGKKLELSIAMIQIVTSKDALPGEIKTDYEDWADAVANWGLNTASKSADALTNVIRGGGDLMQTVKNNVWTTDVLSNIAGGMKDTVTNTMNFTQRKIEETLNQHWTDTLENTWNDVKGGTVHAARGWVGANPKTDADLKSSKTLQSIIDAINGWGAKPKIDIPLDALSGIPLSPSGGCIGSIYSFNGDIVERGRKSAEMCRPLMNVKIHTLEVTDTKAVHIVATVDPFLEITQLEAVESKEGVRQLENDWIGPIYKGKPMPFADSMGESKPQDSYKDALDACVRLDANRFTDAKDGPGESHRSVFHGECGSVYSELGPDGKWKYYLGRTRFPLDDAAEKWVECAKEGERCQFAGRARSAGDTGFWLTTASGEEWDPIKHEGRTQSERFMRIRFKPETIPAENRNDPLYQVFEKTAFDDGWGVPCRRDFFGKGLQYYAEGEEKWKYGVKRHCKFLRIPPRIPSSANASGTVSEVKPESADSMFHGLDACRDNRKYCPLERPCLLVNPAVKDRVASFNSTPSRQPSRSSTRRANGEYLSSIGCVAEVPERDLIQIDLPSGGGLPSRDVIMTALGGRTLEDHDLVIGVNDKEYTLEKLEKLRPRDSQKLFPIRMLGPMKQDEKTKKIKMQCPDKIRVGALRRKSIHCWHDKKVDTVPTVKSFTQPVKVAKRRQRSCDPEDEDHLSCWMSVQPGGDPPELDFRGFLTQPPDSFAVSLPFTVMNAALVTLYNTGLLSQQVFELPDISTLGQLCSLTFWQVCLSSLAFGPYKADTKIKLQLAQTAPAHVTERSSTPERRIDVTENGKRIVTYKEFQANYRKQRKSQSEIDARWRGLTSAGNTLGISLSVQLSIHAETEDNNGLPVEDMLVSPKKCIRKEGVLRLKWKRAVDKLRGKDVKLARERWVELEGRTLTTYSIDGHGKQATFALGKGFNKWTIEEITGDPCIKLKCSMPPRFTHRLCAESPNAIKRWKDQLDVATQERSQCDRTPFGQAEVARLSLGIDLKAAVEVRQSDIYGEPSNHLCIVPQKGADASSIFVSMSKLQTKNQVNSALLKGATRSVLRPLLNRIVELFNLLSPTEVWNLNSIAPGVGMKDTTIEIARNRIYLAGQTEYDSKKKGGAPAWMTEKKKKGDKSVTPNPCLSAEDRRTIKFYVHRFGNTLLSPLKATTQVIQPLAQMGGLMHRATHASRDQYFDAGPERPGQIPRGQERRDQRV